MNIDIDDNDHFFINWGIYAINDCTRSEKLRILRFVKNKLDKNDIIINGYHDSKKKIGLNRWRYVCIVESIAGYNICEGFLPLHIVKKIYEELMKFNDKHKEQLEKESGFDIRNYICYYSLCPFERYYINYDEFVNLIRFFETLVMYNIPLYDFL
jgi:hypothetical protein